MGGRVSGMRALLSLPLKRRNGRSMAEARTAIVTGAGKRVGAHIAEALVSDGWNVIAHVHHADDQVPNGAVKAVADLTNAKCAEIIFAAADGPVSLLINNAARFAWDGFG